MRVITKCFYAVTKIYSLARVFLYFMLLLVTTLSYADLIDNSILDKSVLAHPDVVSKSNDIALQGLNIDQILANDGFKVDFSTQSKLPVSSKVSESRQEDALDNYFNGVITVKKNIYDFGLVDYKINAENDRKKVLALEYIAAYEKVTQKLLNTVNDIKRLNAVLINVKKAINHTKSSIKEIKLRFTGGVGTITDVRQAQLLLLDLEAEYQSLRRDYQINLTTLKDEFGIKSNQVDLIQSHTIALMQSLKQQQQTITDVIDSVISYQRSIQNIDLEKSALRNEIKSLKAEGFPQLTASLTSVIYDINKGLDEYEVYGGVDLVLPLYDSGLNSTRKRNIEYQIKVQNDLSLNLKKDKYLEFNELSKRYQQLQIDKSSATKKEINLIEKLKQLKLRLAVVEDGLLSKLETQIQLDKVQRILDSYPYSLNTINIDYWALNEQLLEKMSSKSD